MSDSEELDLDGRFLMEQLRKAERARDEWKALYEAADIERKSLRDKYKLALDFIQATDALVEHEEGCKGCRSRGSCGDPRAALEATVLLTQKALAASAETRKIERKGKV